MNFPDICFLRLAGRWLLSFRSQTCKTNIRSCNKITLLYIFHVLFVFFVFPHKDLRWACNLFASNTIKPLFFFSTLMSDNIIKPTFCFLQHFWVKSLYNHCFFQHFWANIQSNQWLFNIVERTHYKPCVFSFFLRFRLRVLLVSSFVGSFLSSFREFFVRSFASSFASSFARSFLSSFCEFVCEFFCAIVEHDSNRLEPCCAPPRPTLPHPQPPIMLAWLHGYVRFFVVFWHTGFW